MHRDDLTTKQQEALDKIASAGDAGLPSKGADRRVTVNGNCVSALYRLGLIVSWMFPLRLTDAGVVAQRGGEFAPARYVHYSRINGDFWQPPTYDYKTAHAKWSAAVANGEPGHPLCLESQREDVFRATFPGVEIAT